MKRSLKNTVFLLLSLAIIFVAGCGKSNETPSNHAEGEQSPASSNEKVKVDVWSIFDITNGNGKMLVDAANKFNELHPEVEVTIYNQGGYDGVAEKLEAALVAKNTPVIAQIEESFLTRYSPVAADLSKYMSQSTIDNYIEGLTRSSYVDGVFKAAPMNRSTPIMYINADLFKAAGLPVEAPKTWDQLKEYAKKLSDPAKGIYGFSSHWDSDAWFWESAVYSYGGEIVNEDGSQVLFDNEKGWGIVELWQNMVKDNIMFNPYGAQGSQSELIKKKFFEGKIAMIMDSVGSLGPVFKEAEANGIEVKAAYQPFSEKNSVVTGGANMIIIDRATEEQKKAAGQFLEYLANDEFVMSFFQNSGYLPTTKSSLETDQMKQLFTEKPQYKTAIDQLEYAHKRPWQKNWRAMYTAIVENLQLALIDTNQDPQQIIHTAAKQAQAIIDENK